MLISNNSDVEMFFLSTVKFSANFFPNFFPKFTEKWNPSEVLFNNFCHGFISVPCCFLQLFSNKVLANPIAKMSPH